MALTFPLSKAAFADTLLVERLKWRLVRQEEQAAMGNGEWLTAQIGPPLWEAEVETAALPHDDAHEVRAVLNAIGTAGTMYAWNPAQSGPARDPNGTAMGAATPSILAINASRRQLSFTGLPANYVLRRGDLFEIDYGSPSRRGLYELAENITANGSGVTGEVEVSAPLRPGITTTMAVGFIKPAAKMKLVPGSDSISSDGATSHRVSFTLRQTLKAG